jgi:DNA polymerase-3 subunit epsilon
MAFDWLTGGNLPQFWKNYLTYFDNDDRHHHKRYIVFDMEASGLDWREDVILSIGAIAVKDEAIEIGDFLEVHIKQDRFETQSTSHQGVIKQPETEKFIEAEAMIQFLNFVKGSTLVSHNINLDIEMINQALKRLDLGRLKNDIMDTNVLYQKWKDLDEDHKASIDEICNALKIKKNDRYTTAGNAFTTALIFLKLKRKLGI